MGALLAIKTFFLTTRLGRAVGIGLLALMIAGGIYLRGRSDGATAEAVRIGKETLEPLRKEMESGRAELGARIAGLQTESARKDETIALNNAVISRQTELLARLDERIASIDRQRQQQAQQIAAMSDAEAFADLTARLAVRDPKDRTPSLYPGEVRRADAIIADSQGLADKLSQVERKVAAQQEQINKQAENFKLVQEKQVLAEKKFGLAMEYIEKSDARFKDAYNIFYRVHRRPFWQKALSFGILRDKKITELKPVVPPERPAELVKK